MRQAGILAAAGMVALNEGIDRLQDDHDNASYLADALANCVGATVRSGWTQTNMVWLDLEHDVGDALRAHAQEHGILLSARGRSCRLVTHLDISRDNLDTLVSVINDFFNGERYASMVA